MIVVIGSGLSQQPQDSVKVLRFERAHGHLQPDGQCEGVLEVFLKSLYAVEEITLEFPRFVEGIFAEVAMRSKRLGNPFAPQGRAVGEPSSSHGTHQQEAWPSHSYTRRPSSYLT